MATKLTEILEKKARREAQTGEELLMRVLSTPSTADCLMEFIGPRPFLPAALNRAMHTSYTSHHSKETATRHIVASSSTLIFYWDLGRELQDSYPWYNDFGEDSSLDSYGVLISRQLLRRKTGWLRYSTGDCETLPRSCNLAQFCGGSLHGELVQSHASCVLGIRCSSSLQNTAAKSVSST